MLANLLARTIDHISIVCHKNNNCHDQGGQFYYLSDHICDRDQLK